MFQDLLKLQEYDIYNNSEITQENIDKLAQVIFCSELNLEEIFDVMKCSSKFCWKNFIKILNAASFEDRIKCMPFVFSLLQDKNWPVYKDVIEYLLQFENEVLNPFIRKHLRQAYQEDDEMWIDGIMWLVKERYKTQNRSREVCKCSDKARLYRFYLDRIPEREE